MNISYTDWTHLKTGLQTSHRCLVSVVSLGLECPAARMKRSCPLSYHTLFSPPYLQFSRCRCVFDSLQSGPFSILGGRKARFCPRTGFSSIIRTFSTSCGSKYIAARRSARVRLICRAFPHNILNSKASSSHPYTRKPSNLPRGNYPHSQPLNAPIHLNDGRLPNKLLDSVIFDAPCLFQSLLANESLCHISPKLRKSVAAILPKVPPQSSDY